MEAFASRNDIRSVQASILFREGCIDRTTDAVEYAGPLAPREAR